MSGYVYQQSEPGLWTVGFYKPDGAWVSESDYDNKGGAAQRVAWLNGNQAWAADGKAQRLANADRLLQIVIGKWPEAVVEHHAAQIVEHLSGIEPQTVSKSVQKRIAIQKGRD